MFKDYVVVITGAASGIGFGTAKEFVANGATVIGTDIDEKVLQEASKTLGNRFVPKISNVTIESQIIALSEFIRDSYGRLDILVNNAGVGIPLPLEQITEKDYYFHYDLLVKGPMLMVKYFVPLLRKSSNPNIVNISSMGARMTNWDHSLYMTAKAAIERFTYHMVGNLPGIRVNTVLPGYINTPIIEHSGLNRQEVEAAFEVLAKTSIPVGRIGRPEDIANGVLFLCAEKSSYINGAALVIDGGNLCSFSGIKPSDDREAATLSLIKTDK